MQQEIKSIAFIMDNHKTLYAKYRYLFNFVIWGFFNTSYKVDIDKSTTGKFVLSWLIFIGHMFNLYLLVKILLLLNTENKPNSDYLEFANQLKAYMRKKRFSMHLQASLKFFYQKKFRRSYYCEDKINKLLSGESGDLRLRLSEIS
jgi:hypothetical protein